MPVRRKSRRKRRSLKRHKGGYKVMGIELNPFKVFGKGDKKQEDVVQASVQANAAGNVAGNVPSVSTSSPNTPPDATLTPSMSPHLTITK